MIPLKDDNPTIHFPFITISLISLNIIIFILQFTYPGGIGKLAFSYGAIPAAILTMESVQPIHPALTVFTSMFMHGGLFHIAGNMLYLWIFGNNIEDKLGPIRFIIFYLFCGIIAAYSHAITEPSSNIPMIGASGAVSGILGAYVLLFPKAKVHTLIFLGFFIQVVRIPALFVIGFWAIIQLINVIIIGTAGVAWFAHIGGFLIGILAIKLFLKIRRRYY